MRFVYPYKRLRDDQCINESIRWALNIYPDAEIYVVGDHVPGTINLEPRSRSSIRGCDVTHKILTFASLIGGDFIYMNDDFFIGPKFNPDRVLSCGPMLINDRHAPTYQEAMQNTIDALKAMGCSTINFECHAPIMMNSDKLIELFDSITWSGHNHFIKSMYLNYYQVPHSPGENIKIAKDKKKAKEFLDLYGCFSISDQFMANKDTWKFITTH